MTTVDPNGQGQPAGGLGSALAGMFVRASTDAAGRRAGIQRRVAETAFGAITNHISDEIRQMMGGLFRAVAEHPDTPSELRPLFRDLGNKRGQALAWLGGTATGAAMGGGLVNLLTNVMNPTVLPIIASNPTAPLSPGDAAAAAARGLEFPDWTTREAAYSGINARRLAVLKGLSTTRLSVDQVFTLYNRGRLDLQTALKELRMQGYPEDIIDNLWLLHRVDLSYQDVAAMWNRNIVTTEQGREMAGRSGLSPQDFDRLTELGGEPPAPQELLLAWRRGIIDESDVDRALIQGPLRKEWVEVIKSLQWEPLSPNEAADGVNQGHIALGEAQREASFSGVKPEHFKLMIENAGLPPGLEFASEAYNRGLLSEAEWTAMFQESRIKNRYLPLMREMRTRLVPQETIRRLWREGVYTDAEAIEGLLSHGFSPRDAAALLQAEKEDKNAGTKDLTRAQILDLYDDDIITQEQARQALRAQGYDAQETEWQMSVVEVRKFRRFLTSATTKVKSAYVRGAIDEAEASTRLAELGYGPTQKDNLFTLWDVEREVDTPQLTPAEITSAAKKGIIPWEDAESRLLARGYDPGDVAVKLALAGRPV